MNYTPTFWSFGCRKKKRQFIACLDEVFSISLKTRIRPVNSLKTTIWLQLERRTLTEFLEKGESLSWDGSHVLKAVFQTISKFFSGTFSWIYIQFLASETNRNIKKDSLKKIRPYISSKDCLRVVNFRD